MSYDTRGKLGLADVTPACQGVTYTFKINSPAGPQKVKELVRMTDKGCHTINTLRNPVPVEGNLVHNGQRNDVKL